MRLWEELLKYSWKISDATAAVISERIPGYVSDRTTDATLVVVKSLDEFLQVSL